MRILLGVAGESGLEGTGLLGEIPHIFSPSQFPKASLAVLSVFTTIAGIDLDLTALSDQAKAMDAHLVRLLAEVERQISEHGQRDEQPAIEPSHQGKETLDEDDLQRIEKLFDQAAGDRSCAYELKNELDRLGVFKDYEDRFLDLFR